MRVAPLPSLLPETAPAATDATPADCAAAETRVGGIDLAGQAGTWGSTLPSAETHWTSTLSCDETAAGRQVATNLRLPGQYDERLLGSLGLQGPYYNWNRWYLPGVGRYLELDPITLEGVLNGGFAPDWYNYGDGNPLSNIDPTGLQPAPCTLGDTTYTCCLKKYPGCPECCGGPTPDLPPKRPIPWFPWPPSNPQPDQCSPKKGGGTCSCQHRDVFSSGGVSCQALREAGICTGPYKGSGNDTASCQANARENAPEACKGCLGHCLFRSG